MDGAQKCFRDGIYKYDLPETLHSDNVKHFSLECSGIMSAYRVYERVCLYIPRTRLSAGGTVQLDPGSHAAMPY